MALHMTVNLDLTESVTLAEIRAFVAKADELGCPDDVELREHEHNGDLVGIEAIGYHETPARPTGT